MGVCEDIALRLCVFDPACAQALQVQSAAAADPVMRAHQQACAQALQVQSAAAADPVMRAHQQAYFERRMARHERLAAIGDLACQVRRYERIVSALQRVCDDCTDCDWGVCSGHQGVWDEWSRLQTALEGACDRIGSG